MNLLDVTFVQSALRNVESALASISTQAAVADAGVFKASLDLIAAKYELRAALVGNVAKVEG